jgi:hypothetical protein
MKRFIELRLYDSKRLALIALEDITEVIEYMACRKSKDVSDEKVIEVHLTSGRSLLCEYEYYDALKHYLCDWPE